MSIDFTKLQGLEIPEGVVAQIEDASGRVLWAVSGGKVILEVEKITSDTYAAETTYTGEQFILLDIYPKTNGTVSVTYGGLTKTFTDTSGVEEPNAQQVFFGTFNGVSDSVTTPANGELTIEGDYYAFGCGSFSTGSKETDIGICLCVTAVNSLGGVTEIPMRAFSNALRGCEIERIAITSRVKSIGDFAFADCEKLVVLTIENGLESIGTSAFISCIGLTNLIIPKSVTRIEEGAFTKCNNLTNLIVDSENACYVDDNGCLFDKNRTTALFCGTVSDHYTVPSSVTRIADGAFMYNDTVTSVTIPSSVTSIGSSAFQGCEHLTSVTLLSTTPPTMHGSQVFLSTTCTIIVPKGCGEAYKATEGWSGYADRIVEAS